MEYSGAQICIKLLERQGITVIPGIPGGANLPLYDALYQSRIRHILARHEQGAGFIAQGIARSTGWPAVCFATSGPGATNLVTAIADAKLDSIPVVAITGQVPAKLIGTDAFQEVDIYGMTIPITKHNFLVRSPEELLRVIPEAFRIACSGRPGPVLVDIPKDVQQKRIRFKSWPRPYRPQPLQPPDAREVRQAAQMINRARQPLLYVGGGIIQAEAGQALLRLARKNSLPVASTLMGLGSFPSGDRLYLGMLGMHGALHTNLILNEADLLLAFGVRFDDRATGDVRRFCPQALVIHADIDQAEIGKIRKADLGSCCDIRLFLEELLPLVGKDSRSRWLSRVEGIKKTTEQDTVRDIGHPLGLIQYISSISGPETIVCTDVGQHQMWTAQGYSFRRPRTFLTSGGLGTMGFGLPCAIGAALANPGKKVLVFSGDGSILMNIQELATLADLGLDVCVLVFNNGYLGLVRQQQELFYGGNFIASRFKSNPDFCALARDFGLLGFDLGATNDRRSLLKKALAAGGPRLVNIPVDPEESVFPMVPPGAANHEMIQCRIEEGR